MRRRLATSALAPVLLAACSTASAPAVVAPRADSRAQAGGELRVAIVRPVSIDPQLVTLADTAGALVVRTMCDPLVGTDPTTRELSPALATSWKMLGPDTVQVRLRHGVTFSDGSALTARDVVASLRRVVDPDVASPASPLLASVAGYADVQDGTTDADKLSGISAVGDDTVAIRLSRDDSGFAAALALPFATPTPARHGAGFASHPVCAGPYRLASDYTGAQSSISLVRVTGYHGTRPALTRGGLGWADRITFRIVPTRSAALVALRAGQVDAAQLGSGDVVTATNAGLPVLSATTGRLEYVGLPHTAPFDNPLVQLALGRALDRERINRVAFGGTRQVALNLIPPALPASVLPASPTVRSCGLPPSGDVAGARALLSRPGVDLRAVAPLRFYVNDEYANRALVTEVARQWAQLGLRATIVPVSFDNLMARAAAPGGFDGAFRMAVTAEWADQGVFVRQLVSLDALGVTSFTGYDGELLTRRIDQRLLAAVPVEDRRLESLAVTKATCALPVLPIAWYRVHLGLSPSVVVAAHGGVDDAIGLPELRELAVR